MLNRIVHLFIFIASTIVVALSNESWQAFELVRLENNANACYSMCQDNSGLIWIGTNQGLYNFDGFNIHRAYSPGAKENTHVYCIINADSLLYLGTDAGVLVYNTKTDRYRSLNVKFPADVRALLMENSTLWIGSLNGLYKFDTKTKRISQVAKGIAHKAVYALEMAADGSVFVGTYNGLSRKRPGSDSFERVAIGQRGGGRNFFVNSLVADDSDDCLWVGTEGALYVYDIYSGGIGEVTSMSGNSIKSLAIDTEGNLIIGTDDGLYVRNYNGHIDRYCHDSRAKGSLSSNVVWAVMTDNNGNVWLGTEYDVSVAIRNRGFDVVPLHMLASKTDGNRIHSIFRDSHNYLWLGGTNGIIRCAKDAEKAKWYKMGNGDYPLNHNRIRDIFEDSSHNLWIATDGSVHLYDYSRQQFTSLSIRDVSNSFNANWAYSIKEDSLGRLWVGAYLGGILVADKNEMLANKNITAIKAFNTTNGLPNNYINRIVKSVDDAMWVLLYKGGLLARYNADNFSRKTIDFHALTNNYPSYIIADKKSGVWVGYQGGLAKLSNDGTLIKKIEFGVRNPIVILSITQADDYLWIATNAGLWTLNTKTYDLLQQPLPLKEYTAIYYDESENQVIVGGLDEITLVNPTDIRKSKRNTKIVATAIYVNDKEYFDSTMSVRCLNSLKLKHTQNHIVIEFSDLDYTLNNRPSYKYKLEGLDKDWTFLAPGVNRVSLSNIEPGEYTLIVRFQTDDNASRELSLPITISPAWYDSVWAWIIYWILFACLSLWIINFFRLKFKLKLERIEREKTLEAVGHRISFITNISHELKTPLSMIIGPVSKLISEEKNVAHRGQLELVHKNALKLNEMIHSALEVDRIEADSDMQLIYSHIDVVAFCMDIVKGFEEVFTQKQFVYSSNVSSRMIDADVVKLESIITNIISNSCKYSDDKSTIAVSVNVDDENIVFAFSDDGMGIPKEEQPLIFQRLYQSSTTIGNKEGTGIGLYLVKKYVEMQGGSIQVHSEIGEGTVFTVVLPIVGGEDKIPAQTPAVEQSDNRKCVLIVEDNESIADFIKYVLSDYRCIIAHNGRAALAICGSLTPDLIVTDVMMPVMDGIEMCKRLKSYSHLAAVPIIMLTAKDDKATEAESMKIGIDAFVAKPFDAPLLLARVNQLIKSKDILRSNLRIEQITAVDDIKAESSYECKLAEVTKVIEEHLSDPKLNVGFLCEATGMSSKQLYRLVTKYVGVSPIDHIRQIRLKKAALLLQQKKFTVSEVMYMVGFSSTSYFSKCFNAHFGCTPKQYMEKL